MTSPEPTPIVVCGAAGRMGRMLVALGREDAWLRVAGAIEAPGHPRLGEDAGAVAGGGPLGVAITADLAAICRPEHVVIDFTGVPAATVTHARLAAERGAGLVIGTTGFDAGQDTEMRSHAGRTRSVVAANFSVGVTVLMELVQQAARLLDASFEGEIVELHHHSKKDAPSGTALALGRALAAGRAQDFAKAAVLAREGQVGARRSDEIGIVALRAGDAVGDHTVLFGGLGERIELIHRAQSRECLVRGALRSAAWVADRPPAIYAMRDVLGL
ncbi:MAG TPA: 4-hydroxy-tetrahydrodipicolinate reductase [Candidatus Binatia bacterium]|jgi:4-hydroxy-tetrahydrodipicolinate reductase|nr:4-hydroxy-tetrahydrodipicolinate reductase [Candidatus Binatia bacterium]